MDFITNLSFLPQFASLQLTPLISFGLLLLLGAMGGYLAHRFPWVPSITGFMLVGFIFGPMVLGVLSKDVLKDSSMMVDIALGLILYRLGLSLDIRAIFESSQLFVISFIESLLTFVVCAYVMHEFGLSWKIACLIGAIAVSSSPAVLLHVAHEVHAKGPVTESAKSLVALNNVFSFLIFSAMLPVMYADVGADIQTMVLLPLYRLLGSMVVGFILAYVLFKIAKLTHTATQYKLALVIGTVMIALGMAKILNLSALFAPLVVGIVIRSLEDDDLLSNLEFGAAFELFFIVLFVYAGAKLDVNVILQFWPLIVVLALARTVAKMIGVTGSALFYKVPFSRSISAGMLLIPMAGLAIGLVQTTEALFPEAKFPDLAAKVSALVLGAVAIFETIGPPIAAYAFRIAGEVDKDMTGHPHDADGDGELSLLEMVDAAAKADVEGYRAKYGHGYGVLPFGGGAITTDGNKVSPAPKVEPKPVDDTVDSKSTADADTSNSTDASNGNLEEEAEKPTRKESPNLTTGLDEEQSGDQGKGETT